MSLQNAQVMAGSTGITATAGSAIAFSPDGVSVVDGIHLIVAADTDFRTRRQITAKQKAPTLNSATGVYSKGKKSLTFVHPKILADGTTTFNLVRVEIEVHPESSVAEALDLTMIGAQLAGDTDFASFWATGSMA